MGEPFDVLVASGRAHLALSATDRRPARMVGDPGCDVESLVDAAREHGMLGLLAACCCDETWGTPDLRAAVQAAWRRDVPLALHAARVMADACGALSDAGVRALAYKGPALAVAAYGDASRRSSEDVDIVVAPDDCDQAAAVLGRRGYVPAGGRTWRDVRRDAAWQGHAVLSDGDGFPIELHWRFCTRKLPWALPVAGVLNRARELDLGGRRILVPERHDAVVLLLLHAARHGWDRLESLVAVASLAARGLDGDLLVERAAAAHGLRAVATGLLLAERMFGVAVPASLQRRVPPDAKIPALADEAARRLRSGSAGVRRDQRLHRSLLDSRTDRLRYAILTLVDPTPEDYRVVPLPRALRGLYFVVRPVRLALRGNARR